MTLQIEVIQIGRVDMWPGLEAKAVEEVLSVVFLPVESPDTAAMLPFIRVEELDGFFSTRKSLFLEKRESGQSQYWRRDGVRRHCGEIPGAVSCR